MTDQGEDQDDGGPRRVVVTDNMRNRYIAIMMAIAIVVIAVVVYV